MITSSNKTDYSNSSTLCVAQVVKTQVLFNVSPLVMGSEHFRPICMRHLANGGRGPPG